MFSAYYKRIFVVLIFSGPACLSWSQNLAPNPDFEIYTTCPVWLSAFGDLECLPWGPANFSSPDYFNACAPPGVCSVPYNAWGFQQARSGQAYTGGAMKTIDPTYREYLQAPLTAPLVAGMAYWVEFYVSKRNAGCAIKNIGALFTVMPPPYTSAAPLDYVPQIESNAGLLSDSLNWMLISGCFLAEGNEQYITIGNFHSNDDTPCEGGAYPSYYFIEDVVVEAMTPTFFPLDLGGPVVACYSYEIDPGIPNAMYIWSDDSRDPTLTVTESGIYSVTISDGCSFGIGEVDVTILESTTVDLGIDTLVLCEGDEYVISLDPALGTYVWQDGSEDTEYTISTGGVFTVTLDDGCALTSDQVEVEIIELPEPFTLGDDISICPGDLVDFILDPALGDFLWQDNNTSSSYTISQGGTYSLTISNTCGSESDEILISLVTPPTVDLEDVYMLCNNDPIFFDLDPLIGDYLWQDGSNSNQYEIIDDGDYSVTVSNQCGTATDNFNVTVIQPPILNIDAMITVCSAALPAFLDVTETDYATNFLWQDGSQDSVYTVYTAGVYEVTAYNDCYSTMAAITVIVDDSTPDAQLPSDTVLCTGASLYLFNSADAGENVWQDYSIGDSFSVTTPGVYSLTVTTQCGIASDSIIVDYLLPLAPPDLGPDLSLCPGEQIILSINSTAVNFLWQNMTTADTLLVTTAGIYFVQASDQCTSAADTIEVSLNNNPPQLVLPSQLELCQGDTLILDAVITGVAYTWSDLSQSSSLMVTTPGSYSLTVSNSCGVDADTVTVLDLGPSPLVSLGNDIAFCPGEVISLVPTYSDVMNWQWNDGSSFSTYNVTGTETVTVEVSNACGVAFDTLLSILLPDIPPIDLGNDTSLCAGNSFSLHVNTSNVDIVWSDGSSASPLLINSPGLYSVTISNSCGQNEDSILVNALPDIPALYLGIDQSLCPGEIITLNPGIPNVSYVWQDGSTSSVYHATQAGDIILIISNDCGVAMDTLSIIESTDGPHVNLGPDVLACEGEVVTLMSDISGVNYLWQNGSTISNLSTSSPGLFYLQVSNNCGVDIDSVNVDISGTPPDTDFGPDTTLCTGNNLVLLSTSDPGTILQWQDGSSLNSFVVSSAGTYSLSESNHCGVHSDTILIDFLDPPSAFDLGRDTTLCPGESILLTAPQTNNFLFWQDGSSSPSMIADQEQTYSLEISNSCGNAVDEVALTFDHHVPIVAIDPDMALCPGDKIDLDVTQSFPANYLWNTGSTSPIIIIEVPGWYAVSVQTLCIETNGSTEIIYADSCFTEKSFFVPNVFSPNDDNINDVFSVNLSADIEVHSMNGSIFDRWGNLVFQSNSIPFIWNGDFAGEPLNPGVYAFRIELKYFDRAIERSVMLHGDVTLIR